MFRRHHDNELPLAVRFCRLFDGRRDIWGAVHGECIKADLRPQDWTNHLFGDGSLGIYPLVGGHVRWGCSDIDRGLDMLVLARNLHKALRKLGIYSWVERTKSKGYHVWVFVNEWIPAEQMRNALLVAHQIAGVPPTEVNPKQVDGTFGNYVNLPYAKSYADVAKRVVIDPVTEAIYSLERFVDDAWTMLNSGPTIAAAAKLYVPPPPPKPVQIRPYVGGLEAPVRKLGGLAYTVFMKGPLEGRDRSNTIARLAHLCREDGLTASEAYEILVDADARWGKFHERTDGDEQLQRLVANAYGR